MLAKHDRDKMTVKDFIRFYAATDTGKVRGHNEDNFLVDKKLSLFLVADGMGGHAAGEVASAIAVRTVHEEIRREKALLDTYVASGVSDPTSVTTRDVVALLEHSFQSACSKIHEAAITDPSKRGMGTTLSALLVLGHRAFIAHVGDSRIYLSRAGRTQQVTEDHTVYNELIKRGKLTRAQIDKVQQKSAVTRAVGVYERVEVDTLVIELVSGDTLVLASDGLHGYLESPDELNGPLSLEGDASVKSLLDLANSRGGRDNITTIVVRVGTDDSANAAQARRLALKHDVLAHMPLFARLTERELLRVMQAAQVRDFKDGDIIIREGDKGDELYIVLEGQVRVSREDRTLTLLGPGEHVGEMALIRSVPRSATVAAVGRAELISIRRADFFEILRKEHEVAVKMLWQFLGVLADRLDQTNSALHEMKREQASDDIASEIFPEVKTGQYPPVSPGIAR
jgi:serine/threonine protein phosphatase PrpC/CRP-like cAMP-binding protein